MWKYHTTKINCSIEIIKPWIPKVFHRNSSSLLRGKKPQNSEALHSELSEAENCNGDLRCVRSSAKSWCCTICWGHFYKAMPKAYSTELGPTGSLCWCKAPSKAQNLSSIYSNITRLQAPSGLLLLSAHPCHLQGFVPQFRIGHF